MTGPPLVTFLYCGKSNIGGDLDVSDPPDAGKASRVQFDYRHRRGAPVLLHGYSQTVILRPKGAGWQLRLHEKGGKHHVMPCHHALAEALRAYIDAAGIAEDRKEFLFRTSRGHTTTVLSEQPMTQPDAWRMIRRRARAAGIHAPIGNHSFRATGITAYLSNGGALEHAQEMAAHESPRTTKLYDRTRERLTQDEVERIRL